MNYTIETKSLTHQFAKGEPLLDGISLQVPRGSIFGFLGQNGAGKTTTIKLILGLLKIQKGEVVIFGKDMKKNRIEVLKEIGSLVESPSFYAHMTARENLVLLQKLFQCGKHRVDEVLEIVGLTETKSKKVRHFSLGMKQRLSIGIALLHEPRLLILDEPTNGLDPSGILEIRTLLRRINQAEGTTILISSHLLSEIEKLVSHLAIINKGKLIFQGTFEALKSKQKELARIKIVTNNTSKTQDLLESKGLKPRLQDDGVFISNITAREVSGLVKDLLLHDLDVYQVAPQEVDLETMFINLTRN